MGSLLGRTSLEGGSPCHVNISAAGTMLPPFSHGRTDMYFCAGLSVLCLHPPMCGEYLVGEYEYEYLMLSSAGSTQ